MARLDRLAGQSIVYLDLSIGQCDHFRPFGARLGNRVNAMIGAERVSVTPSKRSDPGAVSILGRGDGIASIHTVIGAAYRMAGA